MNLLPTNILTHLFWMSRDPINAGATRDAIDATRSQIAGLIIRQGLWKTVPY